MVEFIVAPDATLLDPIQAATREYEALDVSTYGATYQDVLSLALHICEQDGVMLGVAIREAAQDLAFNLDGQPSMSWRHVEGTDTPPGGRHATGDDLPW